MKTMKKILAIILTLTVAMTMGMAVTATSFAAKNDSITVNNAKAGETYELYKLFDLTVNDEEDPSAYSYTVNAGWAAFFAGDGSRYVTINNAGYVTAISDPAALAKAAAEWEDKPAATQSKKATGDTVEFSGLADGYWLITSTLGTLAMAETTPEKEAVTVNEKNPTDSIIKQVKEDNTGTLGVSNDAQIGDTIEFQCVATLFKNTRNVSIVDTLGSGLTYKEDVAIEGLTEGEQYTVTNVSASGFTITFSDAYIDGLASETELKITYSATLNENAITAEPAFAEQSVTQNDVVINYGDEQSVQQETTTATHKFSVHKYAAGAMETNLPGAVFSLKKGEGDAVEVVNLIKIDDNNYRVANGNEEGAVTFTTVSDGDIVIWGVDSDSDYILEEITPPSGYNKAADVNVTVSADNKTTVNVENLSGTELPSTGGIGTTLFYIIGALLVIGCGILLVARRRMNVK